MRKQGWEIQLERYLLDISMKRFAWGECDCLIFVSDVAQLLTGVDPMSYAKPGDPETIRGLYTSELEAKALIRKYRRSTPAIMDQHFKRVNPSFAQRGDIVISKINNRNCFGVVWSGKALFKLHDEGFCMLQQTECSHAWRVI